MNLIDCVRVYMRAEIGSFTEGSLVATTDAIQEDITQAKQTGNLAWMESGYFELVKSFIGKNLPLQSLHPLRDHLAELFPEFREKLEQVNKLANWVENNLEKGRLLIVDENLPIGTVLPLTTEEFHQYVAGELKIEKH